MDYETRAIVKEILSEVIAEYPSCKIVIDETYLGLKLHGDYPIELNDKLRLKLSKSVVTNVTMITITKLGTKTYYKD